jgi:hypothetical protein
MKLEIMLGFIQKILLRQWSRLKHYLVFPQIQFSPYMQTPKMDLLVKGVPWLHRSHLLVPYGLHYYDMLIYSIHRRRSF